MKSPPNQPLSPLEQVAAAAASTTPSATTTSPTIPGFVAKLFRMVDEDASTGLIHWTPTGKSFLVANPEEFSKQILPKYFKHNNFSSFVRQLNMYGFHKVPPTGFGAAVSAGGLVSVPDATSNWEFAHPNFKRGHPELLGDVKRKSNKEEPVTIDNTNTHNNNGLNDQSITTLMHKELMAIREQQAAIKSDIQAIQRDSQLLWTETMASRERHKQQQEVIDKILQFLASVFSSGDKLSAGQSVPNIRAPPANPTATTTDTAAPKRPRLMIEDSMDADLRRQVFELMNGRKPTPPAADTRRRVFDLAETTRGLGDDIDAFEDRLDGFDDPVLPDPPAAISEDFDISRYIEESPSFDV